MHISLNIRFHHRVRNATHMQTQSQPGDAMLSPISGCNFINEAAAVSVCEDGPGTGKILQSTSGKRYGSREKFGSDH